jgi:hypothetical protein
MWPSEVHYLVHRERYEQLRQEAEQERLFKRLPHRQLTFRQAWTYGRDLLARWSSAGQPTERAAQAKIVQV